jgi:hypothetical protein
MTKTQANTLAEWFVSQGSTAIITVEVGPKYSVQGTFSDLGPAAARRLDRMQTEAASRGAEITVRASVVIADAVVTP